jgi:hypothetical protein
VWLILTNDCFISNPVFTDGIFFACIIPRLRKNKLSEFIVRPKPANSALRASNSAGFFGLTMNPLPAQPSFIFPMPRYHASKKTRHGLVQQST